ncbi:S-layer homology domain-containing protein [Fusobacterium sp.]|uniref:S-layer homology domain-containing protein n=1 Tax=Fusobacterium sp. TaxID=68766 RepID=UPI00262DCD35|nr:S-layer homology domain-containing protein [Fusobacterium sp.]
MKKLVVVVSFLAYFIVSYSDLKYEDIDKNHWAYKSIEKLVNMGIIKEDSFNFEGNKPITRYEFATELSNVIDTIDIEKANKKELEILETLVVDFSNELNKIGFDAKTFEERVENIEKEIKRLNNVIDENKKIIEKLEERIKVLEKELDI